MDLYKLGKGNEFNATTYALGIILEENGYVFHTAFSNNQINENNNYKRNPKWKRDELILALDLYFRCPPSSTSKENSKIIVEKTSFK